MWHDEVKAYLTVASMIRERAQATVSELLANQKNGGSPARPTEDRLLLAELQLGLAIDERGISAEDLILYKMKVKKQRLGTAVLR